MTRERLALRCPACGPVLARWATAVLHRSRHDGLELLQADCPHCPELLVTTAAPLLDTAHAAGVPIRPLVPPHPPLDEGDVLALRAVLADGPPYRELLTERETDGSSPPAGDDPRSASR